jgi:hypothetical protein
MHRLVQFHAIERLGLSSSTVDSRSKEDGGMVNPLATIIDPPDNGNLRPNLLTALCQVLAEHTNTKDRCFFCIWEGHGWLPGNSSGGELVFTAPADTLNDLTSTLVRPSPVPPPFPTELKNQSKIDLPFRRYFLFEGPLNAANQFGWTLAEDCFVPESPNLFWPSDRTWCVASEIDLYCTLVAGSEALVEALMAQPQLETWRVFPEDPVTYGSDKINT